MKDGVTASRLAGELRMLTTREGQEISRIESKRSSVVKELSVAEAELTILNEQVARAKKRVGELRKEVGHVGPPPEAVLRQRMNDRLGVIGRVLRADRHDIESMVSAFDDYAQRRNEFATKQGQDPSIEVDRELLSEVAKGDDFLRDLPEVVRGVVVQRAQEAQERLESLDLPTRPEASAQVYAGESPTVGGGHVYTVVVPCPNDAGSQSSSHSRLLANIIAAMCQALRHRPGLQAPTLSHLSETDDGFIICASDTEVADDDRGFFALLLEDRFQDPDWPYALEVEAIDNHLLLAALVDVASGADLEENF